MLSIFHESNIFLQMFFDVAAYFCIRGSFAFICFADVVVVVIGVILGGL